MQDFVLSFKIGHFCKLKVASDQEWRTYIPSNSIKYLYFAFVFLMAKWHIYKKRTLSTVVTVASRLWVNICVLLFWKCIVLHFGWMITCLAKPSCSAGRTLKRRVQIVVALRENRYSGFIRCAVHWSEIFFSVLDGLIPIRLQNNWTKQGHDS